MNKEQIIKEVATTGYVEMTTDFVDGKFVQTYKPISKEHYDTHKMDCFNKPEHG